MFGGINIDPNQMMKMQQFTQMCASHPECDGCPLFNINGSDGFICENAMIRLSQSGDKNKSEQDSTTQA